MLRCNKSDGFFMPTGLSHASCSGHGPFENRR
jgi:hypothetical protein